MKKYVKLVSVLLLSVLMCLTFCSCIDVEELESKRAFWGNSEHTVILFDGAKYKRLPSCNELYVVAVDDFYSVTESDVPILLAGNYGDDMSIGKNSELLTVGTYEDKVFYSYVYCRSDLYEKMVKAIENFELDRYCVFDPSYDKTGNIVHDYRLLKDETIAAIKAAMDGEGQLLEQFNRSGECLYMCDSTLQFITGTESLGTMYVTRIENKACVVVANFNTETKAYEFTSYEIPEESAAAVMTDVTPNYYGYPYYD